MLKLICVRIFYGFITLLVVSFGIFALLRLGGSDPVMSFLVHSNLPATPELIAELQIEFGLDKPLLSQYALWLQNALHFEFGTSYMSGRSVKEDFLTFLPNSLILVAGAFVLTILCSFLLGILSALYANKLPDRLIRAFCLIGVSVPHFWLAFLLILLFSVYLGYLPSVGIDGWKSFILPCVAISLMSICINARLIRANMLSIFKEPHIIYAQMRGVRGARLIFKHIFYNAFLPILTSLGMHIGEIIGGALVIESVFALPGIGLYSLQAIANHDYPIIECFMLTLAFSFVLCNLIVDVIYGLLDVRIREHI